MNASFLLRIFNAAALVMMNRCLMLDVLILMEMIHAEEKSGIEIVPVFISVDPERDTVEQVSEYIKGSH